MKVVVDLNADAGESYGAFAYGHDRELFPLVTSVNLACGFHGGSPSKIREAVALAKAHGVAVGAHPGFPTWWGLAAGTWPFPRKKSMPMSSTSWGPFTPS